VDEAASIDVLCSDKTGTLTLNALSVTSVRPIPGFDESHVLGLAALASSDGGQDPVDAAIRSAASKKPALDLPKLATFLPFDPAKKTSEATATNANGAAERIVKGAYTAVVALTAPSPAAAAIADELEKQGFRVLAVATGSPAAIQIAGLIALSDPPRSDSSSLISELHTLGVATVMVTGDAPVTAAIVAHDVGLTGPVCPPGKLPEAIKPGDFAVFAGVLPEGKYDLVKAYQKSGNTVGMCGDGANDAPALRQAQIGIAVSTATDVAKSAAGVVLTEAGLGGIVTAVKEGRITFQRILTYALNSVMKKFLQVLLLAVGLIMTGHAVLTPMLMVIVMITGDFLAMSLTTDRVRPSAMPNSWQVGRITSAGVILGGCFLVFSTAILAVGKFQLHLGISALQTMSVVGIVFGSQATTYVIRGRQHLWGLRPSIWLVLSSVADVLIISTLAVMGIAMAPLPVAVIGCEFAAAIAFGAILDVVKIPVFARLRIS
jgi:H+-transporting ATPase